MVCTAVPAGTRSMKALSAMRLNDALRRLPQNATSLIGSDIARFLPGYWCFVSTEAGGYIEAGGRLCNAMPLRDITLDDIESLAVGAWVLGTGGGGNPYLPLLNMRALYKEGHRVQLMQATDLADDDLVAGAGGMGAPLVGIERMGDPHTLTRAVQAMEVHAKCRFAALMSVEIGGGNGVRPLMAAALMKLPVVDSDPMGRAYPEGQMTS